MQKYICKKCGRVDFLDEMNDEEYICSDCKNGEPISEDTLINSDIAAIIDSVVSSADNQINEKIINKDIEDKRVKISDFNPAIRRINEKCINCGQCKKVCENIANIKYDLNIVNNPICTACGKCIVNCPTGALVPKYEYREVKDIINRNDKIVIAILSSGVKISLGDNFGLEYGTNIEKKAITALRKLGFDYVFNTGFGTDLSVIEEASSFINRINTSSPLPQFTSCCPAWVRYAEIYHPELLNNLSTVKSPIGCTCKMIKTYFAEKKGIDPNQIVTVAITPCTAQKLEAKEYSENIDYVLTAIELSYLLKEEDINLSTLQESEYDKEISASSTSSNIYTQTSGVMESLLRTLYKMYTGKKPTTEFLDMKELEEDKDIRLASIKIENKKINVAVVNGIKNVEKLLENDYYKRLHLVEVMNCEGGCISGSGQPLCQIGEIKNIIDKRKASNNLIDKKSKERCSYENKEMMKLYKEYLKNPLSERCINMLHTSFTDKSNLLKQD